MTASVFGSVGVVFCSYEVSRELPLTFEFAYGCENTWQSRFTAVLLVHGISVAKLRRLWLRRPTLAQAVREKEGSALAAVFLQRAWNCARRLG